MGLLETKWVLFKENSVTHREEFFAGFDLPKVVITHHVIEAVGFDTADEAYRFAGQYEPLLDWWRVGLRGQMS